MHRRATILGLCLLATARCAPMHGQTHKVAAPEKVTRALAVYEWTGELEKPDAARLVPVSLFIDSHFQDAGVYLADPIPLALDTGDVYSIERAGESIGTLDLDFARNVITRRAANDDAPVGAWYGYGRFLTPTEEAKINKPKTSAKLPVVVASSDPDSGDDRPKFIRRDSPDTTASAPAKSGTSTKASPSTASSIPDPDDDERPTLRHRDPTDDSKKKKGNKPVGYVSGPSTSLNDDPDRPTIRRGLPSGVTTPSQLSGLPPNLQQAVAVSDAANRDTHPFTREWASSTERAETLAAIEALTKPLIATYLTTNKLSTMPAAPILKPVGAHAAAHSARSVAKKPVAPIFSLTNERLSTYTLTYGGLATFVYSVEVPLENGGPVYLTLVAQRLPSSELQVSLTSVTDAAHLDRSPWMRPIDVVDPNWSHRGSLLFELRAQTSRQFALYRLISAKAEQTFVTNVIE